MITKPTTKDRRITGSSKSILLWMSTKDGSEWPLMELESPKIKVYGALWEGVSGLDLQKHSKGDV